MGVIYIKMPNQKHQAPELDLFYKQCSKLADQISNKRSEIHKLLSSYETWEVIEHEIASSIDALRGVNVEYDDFAQPAKNITACCFLPVNMPLYSLVLYAVLPSYYFETIYVRPGASLSKFVPKLVDILDLKGLGFDQVKLRDLPAKLFIDLFARDSDVIIFSGKYSNAVLLERQCPESMLIFEGTGPCPFFVFENADIELTVQKLVDMRCFNSGQDCVAPDVIFVHKDKFDQLTNSLAGALKQVPVGDSRDKSVRVAQMVKEKYLFAVQEWLETNHELIMFGGEIDTKRLIIHPTILSQNIKMHKGAFKELFSPVFYVLVYDDDQALLEKLNAPIFKERSMYACVFGDNQAITKQLELCTVLKNMTVNDQEDGNKAYGGYGSIANFVSYKGLRQARPLLLSRDIRDWMLATQDNKLADRTAQVT
ncbi:MAG: aldehyde dehydrogenase family protein [Patescibacteria group bacterium]